MKATSLTIPAALLFTAGPLLAGDEAPAPTPAPPAPSGGIETTFDAGYASDYIFRGHRRGDDIFSFGLGFAGDAALPVVGDVALNAGVWYGSFQFDEMSYDTSMNELRLFGGLSKDLGDLATLSVGITNYSYFGNGSALDDDVEPSVTLSTELLGIDLAASAFYDGSNNYTHDLYYEFSAGYSTDLPIDNLSGGVAVALGLYDESNVDSSDDSDVYVSFTGSLSYAVSERISVNPFVTATLSDNLGDFFFGGVSVGFAF